MENDSVIISVGALIKKNEKYLIARRAKSHYLLDSDYGFNKMRKVP